MKGIITLFFLFFVGVCSGQNAQFEASIKQAVSRQMAVYPKSTLQDLYKNFFQDRFGPGHLIADTAAAGAYLRRELAAMTTADGLLLEETGLEGHFYRVNLSLLKDGVIPYPVFFDAFVRSVNAIEPVSVSVWAEEWKRIERVIASMGLDLPDYDTDKARIAEALARGEYVGHHSAVFEANYSPHYRIISKEIFENELRPYLDAVRLDY